MITTGSPLADFHPAVSGWFESRFEAPTKAQLRGWGAIRSGRDTLIAAPTGSGKTLAAFLASIDELVRQGLDGTLGDETQVVYVSPLRALSNDINKNLAEPLEGIDQQLAQLCLPHVEIRSLVRTGDTPSSARQAMVKQPPHILITTPESLYLLLTSKGGRKILGTARTLIIDEIHAVAEDKRGSHLALSVERLTHLVGGELRRIGLSATQNPIEEIARFLVGTGGVDREGRPRCEIIDEGHQRELDLGVEVPESALEAVMSGEVWDEVYGRLAELIERHRTTLVFTNTRRLAERITAHLAERVGEDRVAAHHGSLSKETRLEAETRLKEGNLKAIVATASLELGIDIGSVDLVCQLGSPRRIATFLQRIGRSGHSLGEIPKGRLFPLSRDDLLECTALLRAARRGELDRLVIPEKPLDILAQQVVASVAVEEWQEDELYGVMRRAYPFRDLTRKEFDEILETLAEGYTTKRGRRGARVHRDEVNGRVRGRRGAQLVALTCGGAIPDVFDYTVVLEPEGTFVGTLNEDFAIESVPGDIFQLGNSSWRILRVESGRVRVEDARGQPPTIPFWFGEAPGRTDELSDAVSDLREDLAARGDDSESAIEWLVEAVPGLPPAAARQLVEYVLAGQRALGAMPTKRRVVLERFFDEAGGMQLVIHAPFGSRITRAWGLALRKRFCRGFNFELEAAATEDAIILSLSHSHSFPLEDVFQYLRPETVENILVQAFLDAPVFPTHWRWNATRALAVLRFRGGRKVPPPIQRIESDDLLAAVFPDQVACLENIVGDREVPDHPLVAQTVQDCLVDVMDIEGLTELLRGILDGGIECVAKDTTQPSPFSHEILTARPYAFLDDIPLEERRTHAVYARRVLDLDDANDYGALDADAIARVRQQAWPDPRDAEELHEALLSFGFLTAEELARGGDLWREWMSELQGGRRAGWMSPDGESRFWLAAERLPEFESAYPDSAVEPTLEAPERRRAIDWDRGTAIRELLRSRLELLGPTSVTEQAETFAVSERDIEAAFIALETEGYVLRGRFTPGAEGIEWCERSLLARIHRYTLNRLRAEIEPVSSADFMRFLFVWSRLNPEEHVAGAQGLSALLEALDGYELPAGAWEAEVLAPRMDEYDPLWLDGLCLSGEVAWGRLSPPASASKRTFTTGPLRSSPIALFRRENLTSWLTLAPMASGLDLSSEATLVLEALQKRGALFFGELASECGLLPTRVEAALGQLVAVGLVNADSFVGLRALLVPSSRRPRAGDYGGRRRDRAERRRRGRVAPFGVESAGRWAIFRPHGVQGLAGEDPEVEARGETSTAWRNADPEAVEAQAWALLRRYGVVFRRLLERETNLAPWRELTRVYRRLEARGDIRGGRFVAGFSGQQYALPEAVGTLRSIRRKGKSGDLIAVNAADPLNLAGIVTPGRRIAALASNRLLYKDGVPVAAHESGKLRLLAEIESGKEREVSAALTRRPLPPQLRAYLAR